MICDQAISASLILTDSRCCRCSINYWFILGCTPCDELSGYTLSTEDTCTLLLNAPQQHPALQMHILSMYDLYLVINFDVRNGLWGKMRTTHVGTSSSKNSCKIIHALYTLMQTLVGTLKRATVSKWWVRQVKAFSSLRLQIFQIWILLHTCE